jgi:hypothetical protein
MDTPETLAADMLKAAAEAVVATRAVVQVGALNIKRDAKANVLKSAPIHNAGAAAAITYDTNIGKTTVDAEIGYDKDKKPGRIGNLLEFGGGGDHSPRTATWAARWTPRSPASPRPSQRSSRSSCDRPVVDAQPLIAALKPRSPRRASRTARAQEADVAAGCPTSCGWFDAGTVDGPVAAVARRLRSTMHRSAVLRDSSTERFASRSARSAQAVLSLLGRRSTAGRCMMPEHIPPPPMARDDDVQPPLWYQADQWRFRTT